MNWIAHCKTCLKELENCPNGHFAHGAARIHKRDNPLHEILVGYDFDESTSEVKNRPAEVKTKDPEIRTRSEKGASIWL